MRTKNIVLIVFLQLLFMQFSCKKYLEEKANKRISTPDKLSDLQGVLDNYFVMNAQHPTLGEVCADNYYLTDASWASAPEKQRNFYIWQKYEDVNSDWSTSYKIIFNANLVLETLPNLALPPAQQNDAITLKGQALFLRAYYHYAIVQLFAPAYNPSTADIDLGVPLKLVTDVEAKSVRATVQENYQQILRDGVQAVALLPKEASAKYLGAKPAAYALLARVNLMMGRYKEAEQFADSCLQLNNSLIDYNTVSTTGAIPFAQFNNEVLYDCRTPVPGILAQTRAKIDPDLYASYAINDLRKIIYFKKNSDASYAFKGNYTGLSTAVMFSGIAVDEVLLIRAECRIRMGRLVEGLNDLNTLLSKRFKQGTYIPYSFTDAANALKMVLLERRKELLFRNLRWSDLKRLNQVPATAVTLSRMVNQVLYMLKPGDSRYVLPIDKTVILLSGMPQNP